MDVDSVLEVLAALEEASVSIWVDGGWGVDALLGEQTREHADLDVILSSTDVSRLRHALRAIGFREKPGGTAAGFVLADPRGREVDVHPIGFDSQGYGAFELSDGRRWPFPPAAFSARGRIGGRDVQCLSADAQVQCHGQGYAASENDLRDMERLQQRFGVVLPLSLCRQPGGFAAGSGGGLDGRIAAISLCVAAALFWLSWLLMPGVGVTDAERIFELVGSQRASVAASVVLQLASAVLYVPALLGIASQRGLGSRPGVRPAAGVLLVGAMGSAADAVLHLLAYAMTAPDVESASLVRVMAFMQGPGLLLLAPLLACFFVGGAWLGVALRRAGFSRAGVSLHGLAVVLAGVGGVAASSGLVPPRAVGLAVLACVSGAQAWMGVALAVRREVRDSA